MTGKGAENGGQELSIGCYPEKIRLHGSPLRPVEGIQQRVDEIIPFPVSVDYRAHRQQDTLRRFRIGLIIIYGNAGGFDSSWGLLRSTHRSVNPPA